MKFLATPAATRSSKIMESDAVTGRFPTEKNGRQLFARRERGAEEEALKFRSRLRERPIVVTTKKGKRNAPSFVRNGRVRKKRYMARLVSGKRRMR